MPDGGRQMSPWARIRSYRSCSAAPHTLFLGGQLGRGGVAVLGDDVAAIGQQASAACFSLVTSNQVLVTFTYTRASALTDLTPMAKALMPPVTSELVTSIAAT